MHCLPSLVLLMTMQHCTKMHRHLMNGAEWQCKCIYIQPMTFFNGQLLISSWQLKASDKSEIPVVLKFETLLTK